MPALTLGCVFVGLGAPYPAEMERPTTLVTGATGYIGGRLVPRLLELGHRVRCMSRDSEKLALDPWRDQVEVVTGDVLNPESLHEALKDCTYAYYLVHSMGHSRDFGQTDRDGASNFRDAADAAQLRRIVYLGGLGRAEDEELSVHLSSRQEVGHILAGGQTPVTELRAAVIIGSGSVSFEMLRYLTEVLPVMTTPKWVRTRCQPISIRDILELLTAVLDDADQDRILPVGGPEVLTYEEMMQIYAEEAGLRRRVIIPVPVLSPGLSSRWIGLVTPLPVGVARPLVDSLRNEVVVRDDIAMRLFPYEPISYRESVGKALESTTDRQVETRWTDAASSPAHPLPTDPVWAGGSRFEDRQTVTSTASPEDLFWAFSRVGGEVGYYGFGWAWRILGVMDSLVGGAGLRRGRRDSEDLRPGEALDFWRVRRVAPASGLLLEAEMKLPGDGWLEWAVGKHDYGATLTQTATFVPRGLFGRLYWYSLVPFHALIFGAMARRIAAAAENRSQPNPTTLAETQEAYSSHTKGKIDMAESDRRKMRFQWKMHKLIWGLSGGRLGRKVIGMPVLELETIGRKTGQPRRILITYVDSDGAPAIVGTNAGRDADPAWVLNLRSNPAARARWDGRWRNVTATELEAEDHEKAWAAAVQANSGYADYLDSLTRSVPIVSLAER